LVEGIFRLPKEITKENKPKIIPVIDPLKAILDTLIRCSNHDYIFFSNANTPYNKFAFGELLERTCARVKLPFGQKTENGIVFKDIRRTVKTNMVDAGVNRVYRDLIFGHSLRGMDIHYIKPGEETLIKAMGLYADWIKENSADVTLTVTQKQKGS
jgi:integrase